MFREIPSLISNHYKQGNINWPMLVYISLVHFVAIAGLFAIPRCSKETLLWAFVLWPVRYVLVWSLLVELVRTSFMHLTLFVSSCHLLIKQWLWYYSRRTSIMVAPFVRSGLARAFGAHAVQLDCQSRIHLSLVA